VVQCYRCQTKVGKLLLFNFAIVTYLHPWAAEKKMKEITVNRWEILASMGKTELLLSDNTSL
jgi:hypothetical protein